MFDPLINTPPVTKKALQFCAIFKHVSSFDSYSLRKQLRRRLSLSLGKFSKDLNRHCSSGGLIDFSNRNSLNGAPNMFVRYVLK